tara:strand:- start:1140 stop:2978 length:1839 start_codon:yes stop_codon:yes gene_type:complete
MRKCLFIFIFLTINNLLFSQEDCDFNVSDNDILISSVVGYGSTYNEAVLYAKKNAINSAVGSYIQSERIALDDEIDFDKIQEFGKGLVKQFCVLSKEYNSEFDNMDDEYIVEIKALIGKEMMYETLSQSGVKIKINTKSWLEKLNEEINLTDTEEENVDMVLERLDPGSPYTFTIKESGMANVTTEVGRQKEKDLNNFKLKISIAVQPNYSNYFKNLENTLKNIASTSYTDDLILVNGKKGLFYFPFDNENDQISSNWNSSNKLIFINKIYQNFESKELNKIFKKEEYKKNGKIKRTTIEGRKTLTKEKFLKKYDGANYHVNASIISFINAGISDQIKDVVNNHLENGYFSVTLFDSKDNILEKKVGKYNSRSGTITFDGIESTTKLPNKRTSSTSVEVVRNEYINLKNLEVQSIANENTIRYVPNELGSYKKEIWKSTFGLLASCAPFVISTLRYNKWSSSDIQPYGYSSEYHPLQTELDLSTVTSISGWTIFGIWRYSLFSSPLKIFKLQPKESSDIIFSDVDYINSRVVLNAEKEGLINNDHEVYNWDIFNNKNNTLSVTYIELPIQRSDLENDLDDIEIKPITKKEYDSTPKGSNRRYDNRKNRYYLY